MKLGRALWLCCWLLHSFSSMNCVQAQSIHRLVVPFPPGGVADQLARQLAAQLSDKTANFYLVDNRSGADGAMAVEQVIRHGGEGNALLLSLSYLSTGQVNGVFKYDVFDALRPVIQLGEFETFLVSRAGGPLKDWHMLLEDLSRGQQKLSCAAPPGQFILACEWFARAFPGQIVVVPFKGEAQALQSIQGGHVDMLFVTRSSAYEQIMAGRLNLLASADERAPQPPFERTPLLSTSLQDFRLSSYVGIMVSAQADPLSIIHLNHLLNEILNTEHFRSFMRSVQMRHTGGGPEVLRQTMIKSIERFKAWKQLKKI